MKTIKTIIIAVVLIFCSSFTKAQQGDYTQEQMIQMRLKKIKDAQYIFEGTVIQQKRYYGKRMRNVLTCSVVQITKIFKGSPELKLGTIKVLTEQGGQVDANGPYSIRSGEGWLALGKGHCIIFGIPLPPPGGPDFTGDRQPLDSNALKSIVTDNVMMLNMIDDIIIYSKGARWEEAYYKTIDSLYSVFKENGLTVQEETTQNK